MRLSFVASLDRMPAGNLRDRLRSLAGVIDATLHGSDDHATSRRLALASFSIRVISAAIAYGSQVLMARWMGDFQYGIFVAVWVGAVLVGALCGIGFPTAVLRFVPEYRERGEEALLRGVLFGSRVQGLIASTLIAGLGLFGLYLLGDRVESYYLVPLYLGAVMLPMLAISEIQDSLGRAFHWASLSLWPTFIVRPVLILVVMLAAVLFGAEPSAVTALASAIVATYATTVGQFIVLRRRVRTVVKPGPRVYAHRTWIVIALPMFIVEGFFNLLTNVDILMVGYLMQPEQVAIYFAAAKTLALVHFVYFAVRAAGAQRFSQYYTSGDKVRLAAFVRETLHWTFWPSLAMVVLLLLVGKYLLMLFGPSFGAGYPLLAILSVGILFRASIGPAETLLIMAGQQRISAWIYLAAFLLSVSLNLLLIPLYGLTGAAWATTLTLIAETVLLVIITYTRLGIRSSIFLALGRAPRPVKAT